MDHLLQLPILLFLYLLIIRAGFYSFSFDRLIFMLTESSPTVFENLQSSYCNYSLILLVFNFDLFCIISFFHLCRNTFVMIYSDFFMQYWCFHITNSYFIFIYYIKIHFPGMYLLTIIIFV